MQTLRGEGNQGPYSQAVIHAGLVFTSGQIPLVPSTGELIDGEIEAQSEQALHNLKALLEATGSDLTHVLKVTVFLTDMADFARFNQVYARFFNEHLPARSCIQAAALPRGVKIEVEAIATLP
ncbi:MAG: RidA family protein [Gemmatimonadaceae bacterium]|nr:RidA family protein [Gloeobacterales cyanobacterium ES-bin-141]